MKTITINVSDEDASAIERAADRAGARLPDWLRDSLLLAAAQELGQDTETRTVEKPWGDR